MRVGVEQRGVARALAVEGEAVAGRADLDQPLAPGHEMQRLDREAGVAAGQLAISRFERIFGEGRQDVGEEQLLMLLLVVDAELDQLERLRRAGRAARGPAPRRHERASRGPGRARGG